LALSKVIKLALKVGGSEKKPLFLSQELLQDKGVVINQDFSRYSFRINFGSSSQLASENLVLHTGFLTVSEMVKIFNP